jgi:hypothetical protein
MVTKICGERGFYFGCTGRLRGVFTGNLIAFRQAAAVWGRAALYKALKGGFSSDLGFSIYNA